MAGNWRDPQDQDYAVRQKLNQDKSHVNHSSEKSMIKHYRLIIFVLAVVSAGVLTLAFLQPAQVAQQGVNAAVEAELQQLRTLRAWLIDRCNLEYQSERLNFSARLICDDARELNLIDGGFGSE